MNENKYTITVAKASKLLDCSKQTIYRKVREGKLRSIKKDSPYGEMIFIHQEDINVAHTTKDIIEVKEVNQPIQIGKLLGGLREVFNSAIEDHTNKINKHNSKLINQLVKQNLNLSRQVSELSAENNDLQQQNKVIMKTLLDIKAKMDS